MSSSCMMMVIVVQMIQCFGKNGLMPFHIADGAGYCFKTKEAIIYKQKEYKYLIVQTTANDGTQFWLNDCPNWHNSIPYNKKKKEINFDVKKWQIKIYHTNQNNQKTKTKYSVSNCWLLDRKSSSTHIQPQRVPIKVALQRMQVMVHKEHYFKPVLPKNTTEDAATLAALSMWTYSHYLKKKKHFYGGTIVDVSGEELDHLQIKADYLSKGKEKTKLIDVGSLKLFAWNYSDIFVVAIRGTVDNWPINLYLKEKQIDFRGYGDENVAGNVHSGTYTVMKKYFTAFLKAFEKYDNQKRIILTGHSLGSGLAQMLLLHLLNERNKHLLPHYMNPIIERQTAVSSNCSLELMTFAGPAIMDEKIITHLNKALYKFNQGAERQPDAAYSALIFYKKIDAISFSGDKAKEYIRKILQDKPWERDATQNFFSTKLIGGINKKLAKNGLKSVTKYQHFGKEIIVGSSPYKDKIEGTIPALSHIQYLEAAGTDLWIHGRTGFILQKEQETWSEWWSRKTSTSKKCNS